MYITINLIKDITSFVNSVSITLPPLEIKLLTKCFLLRVFFEIKSASAGSNISGKKMQIALSQSHGMTLKHSSTKT